MSNLRIMRIPVVSASHISPETALFLTQEGNGVLGTVACYDDGWFVYVGELAELDTFDQLSEDLQKVLRWAYENAHEWIRIDSFSAGFIDGLPRYNHN